MFTRALILTIGTLLPGFSLPESNALVADFITTNQARIHVGKSVTVCGKVASAMYSAGARDQSTFIDLDKPYPAQIFTLVIWGSDRSKFGQPETAYDGKSVCVTGTIRQRRRILEIVAHEPYQIRLQ